MLKRLNKRKHYLIIIMATAILMINTRIQGQQDADPNNEIKRDPFIPLIDEKGNLRKVFKKITLEVIAPQVVLMGISKVGNAFYAIIDGELVKEGQMFKEMKVEKIYSDRVIVFYADRAFELKWDADKKNENK